MDMETFLKKVNAGQHGFSAPSNSEFDLVSFQPVVKLALKAQASGFIEGIDTREESYTGKRYCSTLLCKGITKAGKAQITEV